MDPSIEKEMRKIREKIKRSVADAKDSVKRNPEDDIATDFQTLQVHTLKLVESLRKAGCEQYLEWLNLLEKACDEMDPLYVVPAFTVSVEGYTARMSDLRKRQTSLKSLTNIMSRKLLSDGRHQHAVQAALISLRFSMEVDGLNSVALVPAYLILSEANIGMGNLKQADEYLAHAEWTVLKSTDATNAIRSKLFRNIGILYATNGDYENAQRIFSEDVYHGSLEWGSDDVHTTGGYFHMANVFFRLNKMDIADSLYSQVADNWFKFLVDSVKQKIKSASELSYLDKSKKGTSDQRKYFDEDLEAEGRQMMNSVYEIRDQSPKTSKEQFATICFDLAMFHYLTGKTDLAKDFYKKGKIAASKVSGDGYTREMPKLFDVEISSDQV